MPSLLKNCAIEYVLAAQAAGTSDTLSSSISDMGGWDGICYICALGDLTSGADLSFNLQQNTANSTSGMADIGTALTYNDAGASDHDNKLVVIDCYRPLEQFLRFQIDRSTANAVINSVVAIKYKGRECPVTQGSGVGASVQYTSPAEA